MSARYCSDCAENWPNTLAYRTCPGCGETTDVIKDMEPMGSNTASQRAEDLTQARTRREQFEKFCQERDAPIIAAACEEFRAQLDAFAGVPE